MTDSTGFLTILVMAALTYGLRLGGLALGQHVPAYGPVADAFERLPGLILVALVAPTVLELGWTGLAGAAAAAIAWRASDGNLLATIAAGSAVVGIARTI